MSVNGDRVSQLGGHVWQVESELRHVNPIDSQDAGMDLGGIFLIGLGKEVVEAGFGE